MISSVARSGTGHAFERGGLHKISEHFRAALEATRKYTFSVGGRSREYSFNTRAEPSQWHPRG